MKRQNLLEPGLDLTEIHRQTFRFLPDYARGASIAVTVLQVELMNRVQAVNARDDEYPSGLLAADLRSVYEAAGELEKAIQAVPQVDVAVPSHSSRYTQHDRLFGQYGSSTGVDGIDVLRFADGAVTGVIVQPRPTAFDAFEPQINLRVRADSDPLLSLRSDDGEFHDVQSPGHWYKFPLDAVLVAGTGFRDPSQQM